MNVKRTTAIISLVAVLLLLAAPVQFEETWAVTDSDVNVSIPDYDVTILPDKEGESYISLDVEVVNGQVTEVPIYIMNVSDDRYLNVSASGVDGKCITVTGVVDNNYLEPATNQHYNHCVVTMRISADLYAENTSSQGELVIKVFDHLTQNNLIMHVIANVHIVSTFYSEDSYNKFFGVFPNTLPEPLNNPYVTALITILGWIAISFAFIAVISPILSRLVGFKKSDEEKRKLRRDISRMVTALIFVMAVNQCMGIVGAGPGLTHTVNAFSNVIYVVIIAAMAWQIYMVIVKHIFETVDDSDVEGVDSSLVPLFKMLGKICIGIFAVTAILASFGVDLAGILVSAGVVTLGITLGAQSTLAQFFSGIVLLATRPFKRGDFVTIGTETYKVHNVRLMFTEFENWDKDRIITMPNNIVASSTLTNLTRDDPSTKIFIYISVAYGADLTKAKELMIEAAKMHPHVITDGSVAMPGTRLTNFLDSGIEYRLACFVDDFDNSAHYAGQIREIMLKLFVDNGIEIPYNRLEVDLLEPCDGRKKDTDTSAD